MAWTAVVMLRTSADNGATWSGENTFSPDEGLWCRYPIKELSNGDWIFPVYQRTTEHVMETDYTRMMVSNDRGGTWSEYAIPDGAGKVHASIVELEPGILRAFFRSRFKDCVYMARSGDFGRTWSKPAQTVLPNNNSSITVIKLQNGNLCASYNHSTNRRVPVTLAISEDGGDTWPYMRHLETGENYCGEKNVRFNKSYGYPLVYQTRDGRLHVVYSYANSMHPIKYVRLTEQWIRGAVSTRITRPLMPPDAASESKGSPKS
jgi:predicted neuraminidase